MKAKLRSGFIINGRLAETFVSRGIAVEVKEITEPEKPKVVQTIKPTQPVKRKRRSKKQIEADKKK